MFQLIALPSRLIFKDGVVPEALKGLFPDVFQAMFVLFLVMNGDMDPIAELLATKIVYIVYTNRGMYT